MPSTTKRLFFALWPDERLRRDLADLGRTFTRRRGRATRPENLHITLVFLGDVELERIDCVQQAGVETVAPGFQLTLDETGSQRRSGLIWCGASVVPEGLQTLVGGLNRNLFHCGFKPDPRPFWAHATLARKARPIPRTPLDTPLIWTVGEFVLVESVLERTGAIYSILDRWPLAGDAS